MLPVTKHRQSPKSAFLWVEELQDFPSVTLSGWAEQQRFLSLSLLPTVPSCLGCPIRSCLSTPWLRWDLANRIALRSQSMQTDTLQSPLKSSLKSISSSIIISNPLHSPPMWPDVLLTCAAYVGAFQYSRGTYKTEMGFLHRWVVMGQVLVYLSSTYQDNFQCWKAFIRKQDILSSMLEGRYPTALTRYW